MCQIRLLIRTHNENVMQSSIHRSDNNNDDDNDDDDDDDDGGGSGRWCYR